MPCPLFNLKTIRCDWIALFFCLLFVFPVLLKADPTSETSKTFGKVFSKINQMDQMSGLANQYGYDIVMVGDDSVILLMHETFKILRENSMNMEQFLKSKKTIETFKNNTQDLQFVLVPHAEQADRSTVSSGSPEKLIEGLNNMSGAYAKKKFIFKSDFLKNRSANTQTLDFSKIVISSKGIKQWEEFQSSSENPTESPIKGILRHFAKKELDYPDLDSWAASLTDDKARSEVISKLIRISMKLSLKPSRALYKFIASQLLIVMNGNNMQPVLSSYQEFFGCLNINILEDFLALYINPTLSELDSHLWRSFKNFLINFRGKTYSKSRNRWSSFKSRYFEDPERIIKILEMPDSRVKLLLLQEIQETISRNHYGIIHASFAEAVFASDSEKYESYFENADKRAEEIARKLMSIKPSWGRNIVVKSPAMQQWVNANIDTPNQDSKKCHDGLNE